jgi:hypothetical protein
MGLDTYAARNPEDPKNNFGVTSEDIEAFEKADIYLCGGVLSGSKGSFRGKVYSYLIYEITGVDLYQEWIPPETVRSMWSALEKCDPEKVIKKALKNLPFKEFSSPSTIEGLRKFFRVCAELELGLINSW